MDILDRAFVSTLLVGCVSNAGLLFVCPFVLPVFDGLMEVGSGVFDDSMPSKVEAGSSTLGERQGL